MEHPLADAGPLSSPALLSSVSHSRCSLLLTCHFSSCNSHFSIEQKSYRIRVIFTLQEMETYFRRIRTLFKKHTGIVDYHLSMFSDEHDFKIHIHSPLNQVLLNAYIKFTFRILNKKNWKLFEMYLKNGNKLSKEKSSYCLFLHITYLPMWYNIFQSMGLF